MKRWMVVIVSTLAIAGLLSYLNAKGRSENLNLLKPGPAPLAPVETVSVAHLIREAAPPAGLVRVRGAVVSVKAGDRALTLGVLHAAKACDAEISVEWAGSMPIPGERVLVEGIVVKRGGRRILRAEAVNPLPARPAPEG